VSTALLAVAAFVAMEGVSYATHRWVMHGPGLAWHRSHHAPPTGRVERNDLFPVCFAAVGVALFALAAGPVPVLWGPAIGVTAYGAAYAFVHDVVIHRRLPFPAARGRYLSWVRDAHREHHLGGGEPYGMLLPLLRSRRAVRQTAGDPLDRASRPSSRSTRARL
jgi:beta-carotene 3-hydroxylase